MAEKKSFDEADAFFLQMKLLIVGGVALFVVPMLIYSFYLDRRLDSFEKSLRYRPPQETDGYAGGGQYDQLPLAPVQGQVVYVPAYSHIYHEDGTPYLLTITLSIRNTSIDHDIVVKSVRYFDTQGKQVKSHLQKPLRLAALATVEFLIERDDTTGGSGANFLVEWVADQAVPEPIVEAVMIDTKGKQGISFARSGRVIREMIPRTSAGELDSGGTQTPPASESK